MSDRHDIWAYWGESFDAAPEIAGRLIRCFEILAAIHPAFDQWRDLWRSEEEWLAGLKEPWRLDLPTMTSVVESRRRRNDNDQVIERHGFMTSGWTGGWQGDEEAGVSFLLTAGNHGKFMVAPNSFTLKLPSPHQCSPSLYDPTTLKSAVRAVVDAWQPQWAAFTCDRLIRVQMPLGPALHMSDPDFDRKLDRPRDRRFKLPLAGWLTFLGHKDYPDVTAEGLPEEVAVDRAPEGTYLTIGDDSLTAPDDIVLEIYRRFARPFHPGPFTGVSKDKSFDPVMYRGKVTGLPTGISYDVNGYSFHAYRKGQLLYVHDQYDIEARNGELRPDRLRAEFLTTAQTQIKAAQGHPFIWFFPQWELSRDVEALLAHENIEDISVRYSPWQAPDGTQQRT